MQMTRTIAMSAAAVAIVAGAAQAQITSTSMGTDAPPSSIFDYDLSTAFEFRASGTEVTSANVGGFRSVDFSRPMTLHRIGDGWATWSHGYTGPVYSSQGANSVRLSFDSREVGAFILYVEPNSFGTFAFEIEGVDAAGHSITYNRQIEGFEGAQGFGFAVPPGQFIRSVRVVNSDGNAGGFAVGEFSSAADATSCLPWRGFGFGGVGDTISERIVVGTQCGLLKVTDAFLSGDRFRVRVRRGFATVATFDTSVPTEGDSIGDDYDGAYASRRFSSGSVELDPGAYTVQITVLDSPFGAGGAALKLDPRPCPYGACRADFDGDGALTIFDFLAFQNAFDSGDYCADFDRDTEFTLFDFLAFQNEFTVGCP
ncbi:MAG: GC-type dockerin domain-anchored protein [Planctomycetota bacterium]